MRLLLLEEVHGHLFGVKCLRIAPDLKMIVPQGEEFGGKGVAILAGIGMGIYKDFHDSRERTFHPARTYFPLQKIQLNMTRCMNCIGKYIYRCRSSGGIETGCWKK